MGELVQEYSMTSIEQNIKPKPSLSVHPLRSSSIWERMNYYSAPGVSIAVIQDYQIVGVACYGVRETGKLDYVTPQSMFQGASISKMVTAVAVLLMAEKGILDIHADVNRYLKSWKVPANANWQPVVTVSMLLSHYAGTTVLRQPGYRRDQDLPTLQQILNGESPSNSSPVIVNMPPGMIMNYSGGGYTIVQLLVEELLNKPFAEIMQEYVLEPLNMKNSTYVQPLTEQFHDRAATAHTHGGRPFTDKWNVYPDQASQGLWTTPTDIALLLLELCRSADGHSTIGLSSETCACMMSRTGTGLRISGRGKHLRFGHQGRGHGFTGEGVMYRYGGSGAVIMYNSTQGQTDLLEEILDRIAVVYGWPEFIPSDFCNEALVIDATPLSGEYRLPTGEKLRITGDGSEIYMEFPGQAAFAIYSSDGITFHSNAVVGTAKFDFGEGSVAESIVLNIGGLTVRASRW